MLHVKKNIAVIKEWCSLSFRARSMPCTSYSINQRL